MTERWLPVPGYEGFYEVSDQGRVRRDGRTLRPSTDRQGYQRVILYREGYGKQHKVHRLVCEAFHGPAEDGRHAAHLDGAPSNNVAPNLAWKSPIENNADKLRHGTHQAGERSPRAKLSRSQVEQIKASPLSSRAAAEAFGVGKTQILRIRNGQRWAEPSQPPTQGTPK